MWWCKDAIQLKQTCLDSRHNSPWDWRRVSFSYVFQLIFYVFFVGGAHASTCRDWCLARRRVEISLQWLSFLKRLLNDEFSPCFLGWFQNTHNLPAAICPFWLLSALAARQHLKANVVTFSSVMKACRGHWEICLQFMAPRMLKWWWVCQPTWPAKTNVWCDLGQMIFQNFLHKQSKSDGVTWSLQTFFTYSLLIDANEACPCNSSAGVLGVTSLFLHLA